MSDTVYYGIENGGNPVLTFFFKQTSSVAIKKNHKLFEATSGTGILDKGFRTVVKKSWPIRLHKARVVTSTGTFVTLVSLTFKPDRFK
jgi:hypothetical protein